MKLRDFPERREANSNSKLFVEREKSLLPNLKNVIAAKKYFLEMEQKALDAFTFKKGSFDLRDVNTGYIYILDDCIAFAEKKRKINDGIQQRQDRKGTSSLNDEVYHKMTHRYGYESTLGKAKHLVDAFFLPHLNESFRQGNPGQELFFNRDAREQAYRICDYVIKYLEGYADDDHLSPETITALFGVLNKPIPEGLLTPEE